MSEVLLVSGCFMVMLAATGIALDKIDSFVFDERKTNKNKPVRRVSTTDRHEDIDFQKRLRERYAKLYLSNEGDEARRNYYYSVFSKADIKVRGGDNIDLHP